MRRRHLIIYMTAAVLALCPALVSCTGEQKVVYGGPDYIMFSDTLYTFGVLDGGEYFDIPVCATRLSDRDRNVGVEILVKESDAVYGRDFRLESQTVVIPAGERTASVRLRGVPESMEVNSSLSVRLRLRIPEDSVWDLYGTDTRVELRRCCPCTRDGYTGYMKLTSSYAMTYLPSYSRLIRAEADPDDPEGLILKDFMYDGRDIRVRLDFSDRLRPTLSFGEQVFAGTDEAFGTKYGDGLIRMYQPSGYLSYHSGCERFLAIYMTLYVKDVGTVGTFANICECISDDEADRIMKEGF